MVFNEVLVTCKKLGIKIELNSDFPAEFQLLDGKKKIPLQSGELDYQLPKAKRINELYYDMEIIFEDKSRVQSVKKFSLKDLKISLEGEMP